MRPRSATMAHRVHIPQQKQEGPGAKFKARQEELKKASNQASTPKQQKFHAIGIRATETEQSSFNRSRRSRNLSPHKGIPGS
jgi:hypothetical protein